MMIFDTQKRQVLNASDLCLNPEVKENVSHGILLKHLLPHWGPTFKADVS